MKRVLTRGSPCNDETRASLAAIHDQPMAEVVWRNSDTHAISRQHTNVMPTHSTTKLSTDNGTTLVNLDVVLSTTESVLNDAFHFEKITFTHCASAFSKGERPSGGTPRAGVQYDTAIATRPLRRESSTAREPTTLSENAPMSFSAYVFDYNGVLVDDEHVHWAAFAEVLRPMGITLSEADYWEKYLGFDDLGAFRAVFADTGRASSESEIRACVEQKKPAYLALAHDRLKGFEGASALLRELGRSNVPIGIVSGALRDEIELGLGVLNARDVIRFIVSAEDTRASKPDPEGYNIAKERLRELGGEEVVSKTLVIEDSMAGIESARAAGLFCLAVAHSYDEKQLRAAGAVEVVPKIADINAEFLRQLARRVGN